MSESHAARPAVAVVILNFNRWHYTVHCLEALQALDDASFSVVIVDNGSVDGSSQELARRFPAVPLLEAGRNLGFSGGVNLGLESLRAEPPDYVWLLNNDTRPLRGSLAALVAAAEREPRVGAVGSVLVDDDADAAVQARGARVNFWTGLPGHHIHPVPRERIDYLVAASMLVRWQALLDVGFMDERFFLFWEDADLCFRLRDAGWELAVAEDSVVRHRSGGSLEFRSPTWDREFTASSVLFFRRHATLPWLPILVSACGRWVKRLSRGEWASARATWQGLRRGVLDMPRAGEDVG